MTLTEASHSRESRVNQFKLSLYMYWSLLVLPYIFAEARCCRTASQLTHAHTGQRKDGHHFGLSDVQDEPCFSDWMACRIYTHVSATTIIHEWQPSQSACLSFHESSPAGNCPSTTLRGEQSYCILEDHINTALETVQYLVNRSLASHWRFPGRHRGQHCTTGIQISSFGTSKTSERPFVRGHRRAILLSSSRDVLGHRFPADLIPSLQCQWIPSVPR